MPIIIKYISENSHNINVVNNCSFHDFIIKFSQNMINIINNDPDTNFYNMYNFFDPNNTKLYSLINYLAIIEFYIRQIVINTSVNYDVPQLLLNDDIHPNYMTIYFWARYLSQIRSTNLQINTMTDSGIGLYDIFSAIQKYGFFPHNIVIRYLITDKTIDNLADIYFTHKTADIVYVQKPSSYFLINKDNNVSILLLNHIYNLIDQCRLTLLNPLIIDPLSQIYDNNIRDKYYNVYSTNKNNSFVFFNILNLIFYSILSSGKKTEYYLPFIDSQYAYSVTGFYNIYFNWLIHMKNNISATVLSDEDITKLNDNIKLLNSNFSDINDLLNNTRDLINLVNSSIGNELNITNSSNDNFNSNSSNSSNISNIPDLINSNNYFNTINELLLKLDTQTEMINNFSQNINTIATYSNNLIETVDTNTDKIVGNITNNTNNLIETINNNTNNSNQQINETIIYETDKINLTMTNIDTNTNKINQNIIDQNNLTMTNIDTNTNKINQRMQIETDKLLNNIDTNTNKTNKTIETEISFLSTEVSNGFNGLYTNTDKLINQNDIIIDHTSKLNDIARNTSTIADKIIPITENIESITGHTDKIVFSTNEIKQNSSVIKEDTSVIKNNTGNISNNTLAIGNILTSLQTEITNNHKNLVETIINNDNNESKRDSAEMVVLKDTNETINKLSTLIIDYMGQEKKKQSIIEQEENRLAFEKLKIYNLQLLSIAFANLSNDLFDQNNSNSESEVASDNIEFYYKSLLMQNRLYLNGIINTQTSTISDTYEKNIINYNINESGNSNQLITSQYTYTQTDNDELDDIEYNKLHNKILEIKKYGLTDNPYLRLKTEYCFLNDSNKELIPFAYYLTDADNYSTSYPVIKLSNYVQNEYNLGLTEFNQKQQEYVKLINFFSELKTFMSVESFINNYNSNNINLYNPNKIINNKIKILTYPSDSTLQDICFIKKLNLVIGSYIFTIIPTNGILEFYNGTSFIKITQTNNKFNNIGSDNFIRYTPKGNYNYLKLEDNEYSNIFVPESETINSETYSFVGSDSFEYITSNTTNTTNTNTTNTTTNTNNKTSVKINVLDKIIIKTSKNNSVRFKLFEYGYTDVTNRLFTLIGDPKFDIDITNDFDIYNKQKTMGGIAKLEDNYITYTPNINYIGNDYIYYKFNKIDNSTNINSAPIKIKIEIIDTDSIDLNTLNEINSYEQSYYVKPNDNIIIELFPYNVKHLELVYDGDIIKQNGILKSAQFNPLDIVYISPKNLNQENIIIDVYNNKWTKNTYDNSLISGLYSIYTIQNMINEIKKNNILIASIDWTDLNIDYLSFYNFEIYNNKNDMDNDYQILSNLYNGDLYKMGVIYKDGQLYLNKESFNEYDAKTFIELYKKLNHMNIIIYGYQEIEINQSFTINSIYSGININDLSINSSDGNIRMRTIKKILFNCLIIGNSNNEYYYMVDLIEDYFGFVKYNDVNIYKINIDIKAFEKFSSS
jgi:hypothetical protein